MKVHLIPHTHWDREWFAPAGYTREWLLPFFDSLFARFENHDEFRFVLDGQTILIEDYLSQLDPTRARAALRRIRRLVEAGRLIVGPYYLQPDWQLVSGESLIRNLLIGTDDAEALGAGPVPGERVGWLLDNFGQIAQCVQLHAGFGIRGLFAWRGFDLLPDRLRTELWWESPDGSRLPLVYLLDSYRNAMRLFSFPEFFERRIADATARLEPFTESGQVLLMNGYDQEMEPEVPVGIEPSSPGRYLDAVKDALNRVQLTVHGRQYSGRFISVFPGVLSARNYLKIANDHVQAVQERYVEPFFTVLAFGPGTTEDIEDLRSEIALLWRLILQNHPHDTICGVSADPVHEETEIRLEAIHARQTELLEALARRAGVSPTSAAGADVPVYFNPSLHTRRVLIDGRLASELEPLSLTAVAQPRGGKGSAGVTVMATQDGMRMTNERVEVAVTADGTVTIAAATAQSAVSSARWVLGWRDGGDAGDTYSYDSPVNDTPTPVRPEAGNLFVREVATNAVRLALTGVLRLPQSLHSDRRRRSNETVDSPVELVLELRSGEGFVRVAATVQNRSRDHRLQLLFSRDPGSSGDALWSLTQFSWDRAEEYDAVIAAVGDEELAPEVRRLMLGAREPQPPAFVPSDRAFALGGNDAAVLVAHRGLHELEPRPDGSVAATFLRSVGWLARSDLRSRTGDAGPAIVTPDAQCLRRVTVDFMIAPLDSLADVESPAAARAVEEFLHPPLAVGYAPQAGAILSAPAEWIPRSDDGSSAVWLSAVKPREDGHGALLRLFNPGRRDVKLTWSRPVVPLGLDERPSEVSPVTEFTLGPATIKGFGAPAAGKRLQSLRSGDPAVRFAAALEGRIPYARLRATPDDGFVDVQYLQQSREAEEARVSSLEVGLAAAEKAVADVPAADPDLSDAESVLRRSTVSTLRRQLLEARLSLLYLTRRLGLTEPKEFDRQLRALALELNRARVAKRADDYLVALAHGRRAGGNRDQIS